MNFNSILESLLFVVGDEGLSLEEAKKILEIDDDTLSKVIEQLNINYSSSDRGIELTVLGNRLKLITKKETTLVDFVKNPIVIKNNTNKEIISEKVLHRLILEDLDSFLKELGDSFSYIASEYKIKIGNEYNYIDLLLYNIKFNCYVAERNIYELL